MENPVLQRELAGVLRERRTVATLCGLTIVLGLLVALRWPTDARVSEGGIRSRELFQLFTGGLLIGMLLFYPVFPATSIVREKLRGTLELLLNSPLGPARIYFGKLAAGVAVVLLFLVLSLPAAIACYTVGGLSLTYDLGRVFGILILTGFLCTTLGLLISSFSNSLDAAIRWTYAAVLGLSFLLLIPHYFFVGSGGIKGEVVEWLRCLSPVAALMDSLGKGDFGARGVVSRIDVSLRFTGLSIAISAIACVWTILRLNHKLFDQSRSAGVMVDDQHLGVRVARSAMFLVDPRRRSKLIRWFVNPVMIKEFRCRRFGRLHWLLRLISVCALLSLALSILTTSQTISWDVPTIGGIMVLMQVSLLVLITPSLTAGLISTERETGGWVLLQSTSMPVWRIVWGKLLSVILTLALVMCATLPGYLVMVFIEPGQRPQVERVVLCLVLTAIFCLLLSAAVSCLFRRTVSATIAGYSSLLLVCGLPLLVWLGRDAPFGHDFVENVLTINPIAAAFTVIRLEGFRDYQLLPANWWFMGVCSVGSLILMTWQTYRISRPD
ncbi:MAG TPA: ABC transporter permease [Planctomycetaceae bacterium]|nr:ABC transporter permease [Planctomycetaceae bacterium]